MLTALMLRALLALAAAQPVPGSQTFRSGTQIVEVDVRVLKDGRFVSDLTAADFLITEDGVPQPIQSIVLIGAPNPPPTTGQSSASTEQPALRPEHSALPATWLFVFDTPHLTAGPLQRARTAIAAFIREQLPGDVLAGVVADGRLANNRFTSDREELIKAVQGVTLPGDTRARLLLQREWPRLQDEEEALRIDRRDAETIRIAVDRACAEDPGACALPHGKDVVLSLLEDKSRDAIVQARARTMAALHTIDGLGQGLAKMAGPKTVVFVSEGFPLLDRQAELQVAVARMAASGARVYTIDARGVDRSGAAIIDQVATFDRAGGQMAFDLQADASNSLAVDTGGIAIRNENNVGRALADIQHDAATYYVIGYAATNTAFDGRYRAIDVKVSRPGVKVRARRGYLAVAPASLLRPVVAATARPVALPALPVVQGSLALNDSLALSLPAEATARRDAGRMLEALGGHETAAHIRPADAASNNPAARGWAAYERGEIETAARDLAEAARSAEARPWVSYALGLSQFALRQYRDAAQSWERVRREAPDYEPTYFNLADAYGVQHEDGAALRVLRDAETRWPRDPEIANAIGVIQVRRGALDAAIASFERAIQVAPAESLGYFNLARVHQMRLLKLQRYDAHMEKWIGGDADRRRAIDNFEHYLQIGGAYERQAKEALAALAWR